MRPDIFDQGVIVLCFPCAVPPGSADMASVMLHQ